MLIKQIQRTVVSAWAPSGNQLVGGSAAQQLDATFNTSANLEIYDLNLANPVTELEVTASANSAHRFHKLVWGAHYKSSETGIIVGGCDDGILEVYNAEKLLESNDSALVAHPNKHTGAVRALDFNPFQQNLLATGATQSEIYIWDMNNTATPMTPGTKSQPLENVQWISWNRQVQHILASTFASRCVVWDLRKNEPIIKLTDNNGRVSWRVVTWHPDVATQLCLASEDDLAPVIQMWDLRFATAPLKVLENHTRGVLSIAWCTQDSDLLVSCGKDNRILCWNPNSNRPGGEVLTELARTSQWSYEVSWCPRNPALISACSSDGLLSIYSLMGGSSKAQLEVSQQQTSQMLADSFPGMSDFGQTPVPINQNDHIHTDLAKPPKWLKKPVGASFGFGGKLITFVLDKPVPSSTETPAHASRLVTISQLETESEIVARSTELENAIQQRTFVDYCHQKADSAASQNRRYIWFFLKSYFEPNQRAELLNLLGYKQEDIYNKLNEHSTTSKDNVEHLTRKMSSLNRGVSPGLDGSGVFDAITNHLDEQKQTLFDINTSDDSEGLITQALLIGNLQMAVDLCFEADRFSDALILATAGGSDLVKHAQQRYMQRTAGSKIAPLISALIHQDWTSVVENCKPQCWREALVAVLTHSPEQQLPYLCQKLGERLAQFDDAILCFICAGSIENLVDRWTSKHLTNSEIQDLVEIVVVLQKALEQKGRQVEVSGKFANLLSRYALLLISQGNLAPALSYLGANSVDAEINELKERLICALGHKHPYSAGARVQQPYTPQAKSGYSNQATPFNPSVYNPPPIIPPVVTNQPSWMQQNASLTAPPPQIPQTVPPPTGFMQPPASLSPAPANMPPPARPLSTSSSGGLPRSKYVLDPSVQPSNSFNNYGMSYNPTPLMNPQPLSSNSMIPPLQPTNQSTLMNPLPLQSNPTQYQTNALQNNAVPNFNPQANFGQNPNVFNPPPVSNAPMNPGIAPPPIYQHDSPPGWNDPPMFSKTNKPPPPKVEYAPPSAITHPLYGNTAPAPNNIDPQQQLYGAQMQPPPTTYTNNFTNGYNNQPPQQYSQLYPDQSPMPVSGMPPPVQPIEVAKVAEPPKPKGPIPEEHIHLKTVFDELQVQCSTAATNPQTRRKIDDVKKKLESLYDMLRDNALSPNTLSQLHQMVQSIQAGDYNNGLHIHTQLVSGPDFARIASFMPGLKVLLQCSSQLHVFLR